MPSPSRSSWSGFGRVLAVVHPVGHAVAVTVAVDLDVAPVRHAVAVAVDRVVVPGAGVLAVRHPVAVVVGRVGDAACHRRDDLVVVDPVDAQDAVALGEVDGDGEAVGPAHGVDVLAASQHVVHVDAHLLGRRDRAAVGTVAGFVDADVRAVRNAVTVAVGTRRVGVLHERGHLGGQRVGRAGDGVGDHVRLDPQLQRAVDVGQRDGLLRLRRRPVAARVGGARDVHVEVGAGVGAGPRQRRP